MQFEVGGIYTGKVTGITKFGAFIELEPGTVGMVHISEIANTYVEQVSDYLKMGQEVKVRLLAIGDNNKLSLSIKKVDPAFSRPQRTFQPHNNIQHGSGGPQRSGNYQRPNRPRPQQPQNSEPAQPVDKFEEMMAKFKVSSEEKMTDLRRASEGKRSGGYAPRKR